MLLADEMYLHKHRVIFYEKFISRIGFLCSVAPPPKATSVKNPSLLKPNTLFLSDEHLMDSGYLRWPITPCENVGVACFDSALDRQSSLLYFGARGIFYVQP